MYRIAGRKGQLGPKGLRAFSTETPKGPKGMRGENGSPGFPGNDGFDGPPGTKGIKGDRGETGISHAAYLTHFDLCKFRDFSLRQAAVLESCICPAMFAIQDNMDIQFIYNAATYQYNASS